MDKIKLSEIRAKFPMYADVPDEQLIIGLHKKFYSDIPMEKFNAVIDYDTARKDPTEGMSGLDKFRAGIGMGMANMARGVGQAVGLVSRDDVKRAREDEAALANTGAGKAGNVLGTATALLPAALIPGAATLKGAALIGAGTGALAPSASTEETLKNTAIGGALGPASVLAGRAVGAAWNGGKALLEPFTRAGQEKIAARTLQEFASNPNTAAAALRSAETFVPGSAPTMAQASGDAGLAQLERTLANNPESGKLLSDVYSAQRAARLQAIGDVAGTPAKREAAVAAREAAAGPLYKQATRAVYEMDPAIEALLKTPIGKQALDRAKTVAANEGRPFQFTTETRAPFSGVGGAQSQTSKQITGQALQDLKMGLDDMLSNPMSGIAKSEANAAKGIRGQIVDWMEGQNPAFKAARATYAEKSKPINTMDVADALMEKMQPALARYGATTQEHAAAYARALEAAKETVKKSTGIDKPLDQVIDKQAAKILDNIAKDMGRSVNAQNLGRGVGSNTAQNLAAQNLLRRTLGPTGLPQSWSESNVLQLMLSPYTGVAKLSGAEQKVLERLVQASTNPADAAALLQAASRPTRAGLLGEAAQPYLPVAARGLLPNSGE